MGEGGSMPLVNDLNTGSILISFTIFTPILNSMLIVFFSCGVMLPFLNCNRHVFYVETSS